jgi:hypothetical protein
VCTSGNWKVLPLKIQTIHPLRPFSFGRGSGTPKMIFSLLPFSLFLQLSFLVLFPKNQLEVGVAARLFQSLKI